MQQQQQLSSCSLYLHNSMFHRKDSAARTSSQVVRGAGFGDSAGMQPRLELVEQLKGIDTIDSVPVQFGVRRAKVKRRLLRIWLGRLESTCRMRVDDCVASNPGWMLPRRRNSIGRAGISIVHASGRGARWAGRGEACFLVMVPNPARGN
ncbi:hypothetical protein M752DRAFT_84413 [Aspergillus phoenicis ATCC 13157]|uniref:Uncharacterized protein n=3 Tax=Aspergillus niger TaxID=5061 RepID=A0A370BJJ6_ASPNG|nr:hypothetical protein M747DRAFT_127565 [Aspergillus niger ATCC 13496]RDK37992.1 hypothetical protein M752DRAFT_84413 [Aspergillus phoenicis ATCC 13157]